MKKIIKKKTIEKNNFIENINFTKKNKFSTTLTLALGLALSTNCFSMQNQQNFAANTHNNSNNVQQNNTHNQNNTNDPACSPDLYNAIENNNIDLAKILISNNIGTKYSGDNNITPLHIACQNGHLEIAELLICNKADINAKISDNDSEIDPELWDITPLHLACENGHFEIAKLLISNKADLNAKNGWDETPLHFSCKNGHLNITMLLINNKADINSISNTKETPLHFACQNGHLEIAKLLIYNKADVNAKTGGDDSEYNNRTPLYLACQNNHFEITKLLIDKGADINTPNDYGVYPLSFAIENNNLDAVNLLLKNGANHKNIDLTYLHARSIGSIKKIVDMGFDLTKRPLGINTLISDLLTNFEQINNFGIINNNIILENINLNQLNDSIKNYVEIISNLHDNINFFINKTNKIIPINKVNNLITKFNNLQNYINSANNILKTCCDKKANIEKSNNENDQIKLEWLRYFNALEILLKSIIDLYKIEQKLILNIMNIYFHGNTNEENLIYKKIFELSQELKTLLPQKNTDFEKKNTEPENNPELEEINDIVLYCQTILNEQNPDNKDNFENLLNTVKSTLKELYGQDIDDLLYQNNNPLIQVFPAGTPNHLLEKQLFANKSYEDSKNILSNLINNSHTLKSLSGINLYKIRWLTTNDFDTILKNKISCEKYKINYDMWSLKFDIIKLITENDQISCYTKLLALSYLASIRFEDPKNGKFTNLISNREIVDCMEKTIFCYDFFHNPVCKRLRERCFEIEEGNNENTPHVKDIFDIGLIDALSEYPKFIPAFFNLANGSLLKQYKEVNNETTNKEKAPKAQEELKKAGKNTESKEESTIETTFVDHILLNNEELVAKLTNQSNSTNNISKKIDLTNTDENSIMRVARMVSPITLDNITTDIDKSYRVNEFHKRFVNTFSLYHLLQGIGVKDHKINFSDAGEPVSKEESLTSLPIELITKILSFTDGTLTKTKTNPFTGNYETLSDDASYLPSEKSWEPLSDLKEKKKNKQFNCGPIRSVDDLLVHDQ